jgi:small subunit ribosomal protein S11e
MATEPICVIKSCFAKKIFCEEILRARIPTFSCIVFLCYKTLLSSQQTMTTAPKQQQQQQAQREQTEKSYQRQEAIATISKKFPKKKINRRRLRFWNDIGLGFKTPRTAIEGNYIDRKCPFTGNVVIRGRILRGIVISTKMKRTIIVRRDYLHYRKKYNRFEKRHRNIPAHCSPAFLVKEGDIVTIGQCRPLSKTVRFNVIAHEPQSEAAAANKKQFRMF